MKKSFIFGTIASVLCMCNADAAITCPAGCFCLQGGMLGAPFIQETLCNSFGEYTGATRYYAESMPCDMVFYYNGGMIAPRRDCGYDPNGVGYVEDYSEFYRGHFGWYGFTKDTHEFTWGYNLPGVYWNGGIVDALMCPETYPYSDPGAKSIKDCYRYDRSSDPTAKERKVHYGEFVVQPVTPSSGLQTAPKKVGKISDKTKKTSRSAIGEPKMVKKIVYEQIVEEDEE